MFTVESDILFELYESLEVSDDYILRIYLDSFVATIAATDTTSATGTTAVNDTPLSTGAIAGIVVGATVILISMVVILSVIIYCYHHHRQSSSL